MVEIIGLVVDSLTLLAIVVSVWFIICQIKKEHEWHRRKSAQDLNERLGEGETAMVRKKLGIIAHWYDLDHTYANITGEANDMDEVDYLVKSYLNFLEGIALGVKHAVYDEEIAFQYFGGILTEVFRWSRPYVNERRKASGTSIMYIETETVAERWQQKLEKIEKTVKKAARPPGKSPL